VSDLGQCGEIVLRAVDPAGDRHRRAHRASDDLAGAGQPVGLRGVDRFVIEPPHDDAGQAIEGFHRPGFRKPRSMSQTLDRALCFPGQNVLNACDDPEVKLVDRRPDQIIGRSLAADARSASLPDRLDP
jgi:hypothetical protein